MNSDTLIIIIIFAVLGLLLVVFVLSKLYRSLSATSNPLPPVQPLAHHRLSYLHRPNNSKSSLLDDELDYILLDPLPPFHHRSDSSSRPTSVASSSRLSPSPSFSPSSRRIGLPHSPHSQMHLVLPAPLSRSPSDSSINPTSELGLLTRSRPSSSSRPSSRHFLDVASEHDRRSISIVDRWLPTPQTDSYANSSIPDTATPNPTRRTPSPLISQAQAQSRSSIAATLRSPSDSSSSINITLDPSITLPNQDIPIIPLAIPADLPSIPPENIPSDESPNSQVPALQV